MSDELIEKYFEQQLTEEEQKTFDQRLANDEDFAHAFQVEKDVMEGLETLGNQQLRTDLKTIYQEEIVQSKEKATTSNSATIKPISGNRRWWMIAAATIAGLALFSWLFWPQPSSQELYAEYANHQFDFVEKGSNDELAFQIEEALKNKSYAQAIPLLDNYLKTQPNAYSFLLAKGIAHMETDNHEKAILIFKQLTRVNELYKVEGTWYQALTHLKGGNTTLSRQQLTNIPNSSSRYAKAQELLGRLKKD